MKQRLKKWRMTELILFSYSQAKTSIDELNQKAEKDYWMPLQKLIENSMKFTQNFLMEVQQK